MEKEALGIIISVSKQWWLKINSRPLRINSSDKTAFPYIIKIKYSVNGKDYVLKKWINPGVNVPIKGSYVKVFYHEDKPSKAKAEI